MQSQVVLILPVPLDSTGATSHNPKVGFKSTPRNHLPDSRYPLAPISYHNAGFLPGVDPYCCHCNIPGVTQLGTVQWLNPDAFVSTVDPSTCACLGGDNPAHCQFGNSRRNQFRGPEFLWSDMYLTKRIPLREKLTIRLEAQFFNVFNHPNFGLPSMVLAGVPGKPSTQTGFGALTYATSSPTGLLGVGLGGDRSPRMIAFQVRLEF